MKYAKLFLMLLLLGLPGIGLAFHFSVASTFFTGPVSGYVQIPIGGQPGTASIGRPTLSELGVNNSSDVGLRLAASWHRINIYAGAELISQHKTTRLQQQLISHGIVIPANSIITTRLRNNWYYFGGGYQCNILPNKFIVLPEVEVDAWDFSYTITPFAVTRNFPQYDFRLGLKAKYFVNKSLFLSGQVATALPITYLRITTVAAKINYQLPHIRQITPIIYAGLDYLQINFKDKQLMPNHIRYTAWPRFLLGVQFNI